MSDRINAYCRPGPTGGVTIDVEGMAIDLIMACKAGGIPKDAFLRQLAETWDQVKVEIAIPPSAKN